MVLWEAQSIADDGKYIYIISSQLARAGGRKEECFREGGYL